MKSNENLNKINNQLVELEDLIKRLQWYIDDMNILNIHRESAQKIININNVVQFDNKNNKKN